MKRLSKTIAITVAAVVALLIALKSFFWIVYIDAREAVPAPTDEAMFSSESWLHVPVTLSLDSLQSLANEKAPARLNERRGEDFTNALREDWISYDVTRGNITLSPANGRIGFNVPVSGSFSAGGQADPVRGLTGGLVRIGRGVGVRETCNFSGRLHGSIGVRLQPDWTLAPDLQIEADVDKAEIRVVGIPISVRTKVREAFAAAVPKIQAQLTSQFLEQIKLKEQATLAWQKLQLVQQVAKVPPSWLAIEPLAVSVQNVSVTNERTVIGGIGFKCKLTGKVGEKPAAPPAVPLPQLSVVPEMPAEFHVQLPVRIDPVAINRTLQSQFSNQPIKAGEHELELDQPKVTVAGSKVIIESHVHATSGFFAKQLKGHVALEGTPTLDSASNTLRFSDLAYTAKSSSLLTNVAAWVLDPAILGELKKRSEYNFAADISRVAPDIQTVVPSLINDPKVKASLRLRSLSPKHLSLQGGQIFVVGVAEGSLDLTVEP